MMVKGGCGGGHDSTGMCCGGHMMWKGGVVGDMVV